MTDTLLTPVDVARYLKLSKSKVYYLIQRRQIPHIKIQRNVRVKQSDLDEWLKKNTVPERP